MWGLPSGSPGPAEAGPHAHMRTTTEYLWFNTKARQEFVRITDQVAAIVEKSGVREGMVLVSAMHITAAHLKRTLMGHQVIVPITNGKLDLGPWEQVFYAEFDGLRKKRVVVKVMGE